MFDRRHALKVLIAAIAMGGTTACSKDDPRTPKVLRVGILPDQSEAKLRAQYSPLFDEIAGVLDIPYRFVIPKSYGDLLRHFHDGEVDLAYFGGVTFLKANRSEGAMPLVMRDVDTRLKSYILVHRDDPAHSLRDTRGKRLAFGSKLSTSGHLMPRHFMGVHDIDPDTFFGSVTYSGAHDRTAEMVRDKKVDVGAANGLIIDRMFEDGRLSKLDVRVLWESPPYPDYVWAVPAGLPDDFRDQLRDGFLALSPADADAAKILKSVGAGGFLPARMEDFQELADLMKQLGLLAG